MDIKDLSLGDILDFVKFGSNANAPQEIVDYCVAMDKVRGMYLRQGDFGTKDAIVNHLIKIDGLSYYMANKLYNQTLEYFYCDSGISKKAWKNIYADKLDKAAAFALAVLKDARDAKAYAAIVKEAYIARGLDEPDPVEIPRELLEKPFIIYDMDPTFIGQGKINRLELAQLIDNLEDVTELQKDVLKKDAGIIPINTLFYNEQEDSDKQ